MMLAAPDLDISLEVNAQKTFNVRDSIIYFQPSVVAVKRYNDIVHYPRHKEFQGTISNLFIMLEKI